MNKWEKNLLILAIFFLGCANIMAEEYENNENPKSAYEECLRRCRKKEKMSPEGALGCHLQFVNKNCGLGEKNISKKWGVSEYKKLVESIKEGKFTNILKKHCEAIDRKQKEEFLSFQDHFLLKLYGPNRIIEENNVIEKNKNILDNIGPFIRDFLDEPFCCFTSFISLWFFALSAICKKNSVKNC